MVKRIVFFFLAFTVFAYGLWQLSNARTFQLFGHVVASVPAVDRVVALTFDDGPTAGYTNEVLAVLRERNVKATFFVTGREMEQNPQQGRQIVDAGHELGNHSFSHPTLIFKRQGTIKEEIERTDAAIRSAGHEGVIFFRPPYGKKLFGLPWYLHRTGRTTVTWDIEPESYPEVASSAEKIADHVLEKVQPGSIVLLHLMYGSREESRKSLPIVIDRLREGGYSFLTVSELLKQEP